MISKIGFLLNLFVRAESIDCIKIESYVLSEEYLNTLKNDSCHVRLENSDVESRVTGLKLLFEISSELIISNETKHDFSHLNNFLVYFSRKTDSLYFYEPVQDFKCLNLNCSKTTFLPQNLSFENSFNASNNNDYVRCYFVSENQNITLESNTDDNLALVNAIKTNVCLGPNVRMVLKLNLKNISETFNIFGYEKFIDTKLAVPSRIYIYLNKNTLRSQNEFSLKINCKNNLEINFENIFEFKKNISNATNLVQLDECILGTSLLESVDILQNTSRDNFLSKSYEKNFNDLETFLFKFFCYFNSCFFDDISKCLPYWQNHSDTCFFKLNSSRFSKENNMILRDINRKLINFENNYQKTSQKSLQRLLLHIDDLKSKKYEQSKLTDVFILITFAFSFVMAILFIIYAIKVNINQTKKTSNEIKISIKDSKVLGLKKIMEKKIAKKKSKKKMSSESIIINVTPKNIIDMDKYEKLNLKALNHNKKIKLISSKSLNMIKSKTLLFKPKSLNYFI